MVLFAVGLAVKPHDDDRAVAGELHVECPITQVIPRLFPGKVPIRDERRPKARADAKPERFRVLWKGRRARPGTPERGAPNFGAPSLAEAVLPQTSLRVGRGAFFSRGTAGDLLETRSTVALAGSFAAEFAHEQGLDTDHQDGAPHLHSHREAERVEPVRPVVIRVCLTAKGLWPGSSQEPPAHSRRSSLSSA